MVKVKSIFAAIITEHRPQNERLFHPKRRMAREDRADLRLVGARKGIRGAVCRRAAFAEGKPYSQYWQYDCY